jgi:transposase
VTYHTIPTAGIDTAKDKLDVAIHGLPTQFTVENRRPGWRRLATALVKAGVKRVGIEATGGYERGVVGHLRAAGFTRLVLQPLQVKAYARLHLRRAKNDRLDAVLIAACAAVLDAPPSVPDRRLPPLAEALTFVEQIEEDIARCKTRLEHITQPRLRRLALADIKRLQARRAAELKPYRPGATPA